MKETIYTIDLDGVNCYLIRSKEGDILVDTGGPMFLDKEVKSRRAEIEKELVKLNCTKETLKVILLTHGDCDHSYNARYLSEKYDVPVAIHKDDCNLVQQMTVQQMLSNSRYHSIGYRIIMSLLKPIIKKMAAKISNEFETFIPKIILQDGMRLDAYGVGASIVHIPGHTQGSIAIVTDEGEALVGDSYVNLKKPSYAINALDYKQLVSNLHKLDRFSIHRIYPGHGKPFDRKEL
ncbi:MBL fold metallo-hydrolase [Anaerosporobacter faecicola]|uniref:MBL fold metallo-hydrolase n=1 Tax=Anaerosporobacter faecicola TaxID=2718714 RepID=UPI001438BB96|nr:MBL fold metallo-hydrolase [Anaerosporobacter faecicola]